MGLAVLPARLKKEMAELEQAILNHEDLRQNETMAAHAEWAEGWIPKYKITDSNIHSIIQKEIGIVFAKVLEDAGVYKRTDEGKAAFKRFIESLYQSIYDNKKFLTSSSGYLPSKYFSIHFFLI